MKVTAPVHIRPILLCSRENSDIADIPERVTILLPCRAGNFAPGLLFLRDHGLLVSGDPKVAAVDINSTCVLGAGHSPVLGRCISRTSGGGPCVDVLVAPVGVGGDPRVCARRGVADRPVAAG